jgi:hypothetical protein
MKDWPDDDFRLFVGDLGLVPHMSYRVVYIYICTLCVSVHVCVCIHRHTHTHITCIRTYTRSCIHVCICAWICIYMCVCVYIPACLHQNAHVYTTSSSLTILIHHVRNEVTDELLAHAFQKYGGGGYFWGGYCFTELA